MAMAKDKANIKGSTSTSRPSAAGIANAARKATEKGMAILVTPTLQPTSPYFQTVDRSTSSPATSNNSAK
jgi:hypothetical protein